MKIQLPHHSRLPGRGRIAHPAIDALLPAPNQKAALVGSSGTPSLDNLYVTQQSQPVYLTAGLTSTSWDGDAYATMASRSAIDLSAVFGVPAEITAVTLYVAVQSATVNARLYLGPAATGDPTAVCRCQVASQWFDYQVTIPCNADGDIYYQVLSASTNIILRVWSYVP